MFCPLNTNCLHEAVASLQPQSMSTCLFPASYPPTTCLLLTDNVLSTKHQPLARKKQVCGPANALVQVLQRAARHNSCVTRFSQDGFGLWS
eukprot:1159929-Pelagomonas_calceolata.AAC.12